MKNNLLKFTALLFVSTAMFTSCKKDNPTIEGNDEEVITTMIVKLTPQGGGAVVEAKFDDPDGPGGAAATIEPIILAPSKTYTAQILLLNKTANPVDTISDEVENEGIAHRLYFEPTGTNLTVSVIDKDDNGISLGLLSTWTTGASSASKIRITLRHYDGLPPNKAEADLVTSTKSSTDITTADIGDFIVRIQ